MKHFFSALLFSCIVLSSTGAELARTVPTFHCMSLYWPRDDGAFTNRCDVRYRAAGAAEWREGHELWWDKVHQFYAGAVVSLEAGKEYEFRLTLANGATTTLRGRTWANEFPVARVVKLAAGTRTEPLVITEGGSAAGYVVYEADAAGTTIDADPGGGDESDAREHCVVIDADYVIVRGLTLRNAKSHAVLIKNRHDLVIEGCDISNWGRRDPRAGQRGKVNRYNGGGSVEATFAKNLAMQMESAIKGEGAATHDIERVVVQGNRIHHPRYGANSWSEGSAFFNSFHPQGAKAVCLFRPGEELPTKGNHVIRYNEFFSDRDRMFYDILFDSQGAGPKQGTDAQRDMDIYGNVFRDCLDDCMELERGFGNVRVFENWFDNVFKAETGFTSQSGPYYMFRNVFDRVLQPSRDHAPDTRAWTGCAYQSGERRFYFYHNTMLCPGGDEGAGFAWAYGNDFKKIGEGRGTVDDGNFTISRNNIYQTIRWPDEVNYVTRRVHGGFSFDYELYNGVLDTSVPEAVALWGRHAIQGVPVYRDGNGSGRTGRAQLEAKSPGMDAGVRIPNFNDHYEGTAPDIGAHEHGSPDMNLGVEAYRRLYAVRKTAAAHQQAPVDFNHPPRDYAAHTLHGWEVLVEKQLAEEAPELAKSTLSRVEAKLGQVAALLPAAALSDLQKLKVFVLYGAQAKAGGRTNGLEYFQRDAPKHWNWLDARMASSIVIFSADNYVKLSEAWALKSLMHEFGHAQHLEHWPEQHADIYETWQAALKAGRYQTVRHADKSTHFPNYAARNHLEYFAELTATYFTRGNYFPYDRAGLKAYDPEGFALVEQLWGVKENK